MPLSHTHTHTHTQMPVFPASRLASAPQAEAGPGVGGSCHMLARPTRITNRLLLSRPTAGVWQWVRVCISLTSEQAHCCHTHIMHTSLRSVPDKEDEINAGERKEKDDKGKGMFYSDPAQQQALATSFLRLLLYHQSLHIFFLLSLRHFHLYCLYPVSLHIINRKKKEQPYEIYTECHAHKKVNELDLKVKHVLWLRG